MKKLDKNLSKILDIQLALGVYDLVSGVENKEVNESITYLNEFRSKRKDMSKEEELKESNLVLDKLNKALDSVGRDKFIFYDDGDINYVGDKSFKKKGDKTKSNSIYYKNLEKIYNIKLEIESDETITGNINELSNEAFLALKKLEEIEYILNEKEKIKISKEVLNKFQEALKQIK